jgi:hypothetical protein
MFSFSAASRSTVDACDRFDGDERHRHVGAKRSGGARRQSADRLEHLDALRDAREHRIAWLVPAVELLGVVGEIDEELRSRRVGIVGARRRDGAACVVQAVARLVPHGRQRRARA